MCGSGRPGRSSSNLWRQQLHRWRVKERRTFRARSPGIEHVSPLLQHVAALLLVFGLVIDAARTASLFVGKALLDPVAVEAEFIQERRARATQIVHGEQLKR